MPPVGKIRITANGKEIQKKRWLKKFYPIWNLNIPKGTNLRSINFDNPEELVLKTNPIRFASTLSQMLGTPHSTRLEIALGKPSIDLKSSELGLFYRRFLRAEEGEENLRRVLEDPHINENIEELVLLLAGAFGLGKSSRWPSNIKWLLNNEFQKCVDEFNDPDVELDHFQTDLLAEHNDSSDGVNLYQHRHPLAVALIKTIEFMTVVSVNSGQQNMAPITEQLISIPPKLKPYTGVTTKWDLWIEASDKALTLLGQSKPKFEGVEDYLFNGRITILPEFLEKPTETKKGSEPPSEERQELSALDFFWPPFSLRFRRV